MSTRYGREALRLGCERITAAPEHERNTTLSLEAGSIGQLVAGGEIGEAEASKDLTRAALAAGLARSEIAATIRSGFAYGAKKPRGRRAKVRANLREEIEAQLATPEAKAIRKANGLPEEMTYDECMKWADAFAAQQILMGTPVAWQEPRS